MASRNKKKNITDLLTEYNGDFQKFLEQEGKNYNAKDIKTIEKNFKDVGAQYATQKNFEKQSGAGITNASGSSSMADNPTARAISAAYDKTTMLPDSAETRKAVADLAVDSKNALEKADGKTEEEQKEIAKEIKEKYLKEKADEPKKSVVENAVKNIISQKSVTTKDDKKETSEKQKEINDKKNSFLASWAATHPSWVDILKGDELTKAQKIQLVLGAMANIGANTVMGAKAGFEHSGFKPIDWDFKDAIDQYTKNEIDNALTKEQAKRGDELAANYLSDMQERYGDDKMSEMFELAALYGDDSQKLEEMFKAKGIKANGKEFADAYGKFKAVELQEGAKREKIKTTIDSAAAKLAQINNQIAQLEKQGKKVDVNIKKKTADLLIQAQNAQNDYNKTKYSSDKDTYSLEKYAGYAANVLHEIEGVADVVTNIGSDGNLKDIISRSDNAMNFQKRLGYGGGEINKDFSYYLNKLRG